MKNVTKILTAALLCAAIFASDQRIDALGGNAAFWPGDEANIAVFPAQVNNHSYLQFSGVGGDDSEGHASLLVNKDGKALVIKEDVGRHNALDKVIGHALKNSIFDTKNQFIDC